MRAFDDPPLGGGLATFEGAGKLTISAGPIKPSLVSDLYSSAAAFIGVDIAISVPSVFVLVKLGGADPLFWVIWAAQLLTISIGGTCLRRWILGIAGRAYEISLDPFRAVVIRKSGERVTRAEIPLADVLGVERDTIVSLGESPRPRPEIVQLMLKSKTGDAIEILNGRPREETLWVQSRIERFLNENSIGQS
jgi:hypothetical protein